MSSNENPNGWDVLCPNGRVVFYEGDDPATFVAAMAVRGIEIEESERDWTDRRSFFIPAGRVEEIYGSGRWPLGS